MKASEIRTERRQQQARTSEAMQWVFVIALGAAACFGVSRVVENYGAGKGLASVSVKPVPEKHAVPNMVPRDDDEPGYNATASTIERRSVERQPDQAKIAELRENERRFYSMRDNCNRAALMNSAGEYPAMQERACGDFARYAQSKGWSAGAIPETRIAQQSQRPQISTSAASQNAGGHSGVCEILQAEKDSINAQMRQSYRAQEGEFYRSRLRALDDQIWDLNCRNH